MTYPAHDFEAKKAKARHIDLLKWLIFASQKLHSSLGLPHGSIFFPKILTSRGSIYIVVDRATTPYTSPLCVWFIHWLL
jgi:hypothetical protein